MNVRASFEIKFKMSRLNSEVRKPEEQIKTYKFYEKDWIFCISSPNAFRDCVESAKL